MPFWLASIYWIATAAVLSEYVQLVSDRGTFFGSISGRSRCDSCQKEIPWYSLVPIIGGFFTRQRCSHCGKQISKSYVRFELMFTVIFGVFLFAVPGMQLASFIDIAALLFAYCVTWLLMYEDAKHYSVPVSWLLTWAISFASVWLLFDGGKIYWVDMLLMSAVLVLSVFVVSIRRKTALKELSSLFGGADVIVLGVITVFMGFEKTTFILILTLLTSGVYLLWQKRLKVGQRVPLLTMMLMWGLAVLLF
jgi:leader peptidase (prepilin peptidase)/N-methyltransferase